MFRIKLVLLINMSARYGISSLNDNLLASINLLLTDSPQPFKFCFLWYSHVSLNAQMNWIVLLHVKNNSVILLIS